MNGAMPERFSTQRIKLAFAGVACIAGLSVFVIHPIFNKNDLSLTGRIFNAATKEPYEGALVLGIYRKCMGRYCWCKRTISMRTGSDGIYRFPVTALDGAPSLAVFAPGKYVKAFEIPDTKVLRKGSKDSYSDWNAWLAPQDPENPSFRYEMDILLPCPQTATREDVVAGKEFESLVNVEREKLGSKR